MAKRIMLAFCSLLCLLVMNTSLAAQDKPATPADIAAPLAQSATQVVQSMAGFPVLFAGSEVALVSNSLTGELTPENRARLIQQNIQVFADSKADISGIRIIKLPEGFGIGTDESILMVITPRDAENTGKSADELTQQTLAHIQAALENYRTHHHWKTYGLGAALTLLSMLVLWQALHWNNRAFAWLKDKASFLHDRRKGGIHFKQVEVVSARRIERIVLMTLKSARIFVILLCLYFFLPLILSFFPETRELSSRILDYLITPFVSIFSALIRYIPNLAHIFVIGLIAFYVLKFISYVFKLIERGKLKFDWFYQDWARPTYQIIRFLIIVTALISSYPYIPGSSSQAFQGVGLVLGAIISFASSSAISNIVAGIILTYTRAFKLGDRIQVGDSVGDVVEKTLLVTRVNTIKEVIVTIPNSLVMSSQIINYSTSAADGDGVILHTSVTIGYDVPWRQVEELLVQAAIDTEHVLKKPAPFVLQTSLDDYFVTHEINAYTREPQYMANIYSDLHTNILDKFDAAGVEIMSPHYYALRDGNASTVPSVLETKGYQQPGFRVGKGPEAGQT